MSPDPGQLLTRPEAAALAALSPDTLRWLEAQGRGPVVVRIGTRVRYRRSDLDAWIDSMVEAS